MFENEFKHISIENLDKILYGSDINEIINIS